MSDYIEIPDGLSLAFDDLYDRGWTDGLPVIPPTPELVDEMISHVAKPPGEVIAEIPPTRRRATVEAIAANAVMAGCRPEYMPALIAIVRAVCDPAFNLTGIQATGDSVGPAIMMNGPVRLELDLNCAEGAAGPGRRANATIGRALRLMLMNIGGALPGTTDRAMIGQPGKFTFCMGENEEASPWEPFHVGRGFEPNQSMVTLLPALGAAFSWPLLVDAETVLQSMVNAMTMSGNATHGYWTHPLSWIVPPANAGLLTKAGLSKEDLQQYLFEHARIPVAEFPCGPNQMWEFEPLVEGDEVLLVKEPQDIYVFVVGGGDYSGAILLGGWHATPVSVAIEPVSAESVRVGTATS
jgi:hypothetical protein